jgi:hypothetical protein
MERRHPMASQQAWNVYNVYRTKFSIVVRASMFFLVLLTYFEPPLWCTGDLPYPCGNTSCVFFFVWIPTIVIVAPEEVVAEVEALLALL